MKNKFSKKTEALFEDVYYKCWECGRSHANCNHHIKKRISNSPYNLARLSNFECHWPEYRSSNNLEPIHSSKVEQKYLRKTKKYLDSINYKPTKEDIEFLKINLKKDENSL